MAETFSFFEEGIKSYIDQSISKYAENQEIIFSSHFDNKLLNPLFINDISLFKNLIQKNKLKIEIWKSLGETIFKKLNDILNIFDKNVVNINNKIPVYEERIKQLEKYIQKLEEKKVEKNEIIQYNIKKDKQKQNNEEHKLNNIEQNNERENKEEDNLSDVHIDENIFSKNNAALLGKITEYNAKIEDGQRSIRKNEDKIVNCKKKLSKGEINLLKFQILHLTVNILINEINKNIMNNDNYDKEKSYKLINNYLNKLIEKYELINEEEDMNINYIIFIKSYIIELVLIINNEGYKDINKYFLNQLLNNINSNQKKYESDELKNLISYIEKVENSPDTFLCPNAFSILKDASFKKIRPRSRNNSFDKNEININNINNNDIKNNKNEKNSRIDDYFKKKKSESDEEEEEYNKRLSSVISFKNSKQNINNNNILYNNNFHSQFSFGLNENNSRFNFSSMNSALSNNTLLNLDLQIQSSNLLNSSRLSGEDSMSKHSLYKGSSFSELFPHDSVLSGGQAGINSRLATSLPSLRISKKEKKKKNSFFDKFQSKLEKDYFKKKDNKENSDKIINREIYSIISDKFYNSGNISNDDKNKNTTASENKKNNKNKILIDENETLKFKDKKKLGSNEILISKTPIKFEDKNEKSNEDENNENLQVNEIKKNLGVLFNQHAGK